MSEQKETLQDVASLIEERRRYEEWLATLETRRAATPVNVFDRVSADYRSRLEHVAEQLASHRGSLGEELAGLRSRLSQLDAEQQLRRDERAEVELRALVGELSELDVATALKSIDEGLTRMGAESDSLRSDVDRVSEYLSAASRGLPGAVGGSGAERTGSPVAASEPVSNDVAPQPAVAAAPVEARPEPPVAAAPVAEPTIAAPSAAPSAEPSGTSPAVTLPKAKRQRDSFDELGFLTAVMDGPSHAAPPPSRATVSVRAASVAEATSSPASRSSAGVAREQEVAPPARPAPEPEAVAPRKSGMHQARTSTSELPALEIVRETRPSASLLAGLDGGGTESDEAPFAANIPANTPIRFRPSTQIEQPKTLKCSECGSLNYPTEWYCERCGAELAAL